MQYFKLYVFIYNLFLFFLTIEFLMFKYSFYDSNKVLLNPIKYLLFHYSTPIFVGFSQYFFSNMHNRFISFSKFLFSSPNNNSTKMFKNHLANFEVPDKKILTHLWQRIHYFQRSTNFSVLLFGKRLLSRHTTIS